MLNYTLTLCRLLNQALTDRQDTIDQWQYTYDKNSKATAPALAPYLLPVGKATAPAPAPYLRPVGNIIQMTLPNGRVADYTRDGVRRIAGIDTTLNGTAQSIVSNIQYRGDAVHGSPSAAGTGRRTGSTSVMGGQDARNDGYRRD